MLQYKLVSFQRNCVAASMEEYNKVIWYYQLSSSRKLATVKSYKANVSSVCRASERMEKLWVVCACLSAEIGATPLVVIW